MNLKIDRRLHYRPNRRLEKKFHHAFEGLTVFIGKLISNQDMKNYY
jgi:hypothetical protein